ncbi:hypothetical protein SD78_1218 [Bacillus badius]|nr:hypothetical protein SD78_1218 [Bacillus badius]
MFHLSSLLIQVCVEHPEALPHTRSDGLMSIVSSPNRSGTGGEARSGR